MTRPIRERVVNILKKECRPARPHKCSGELQLYMACLSSVGSGNANKCSHLLAQYDKCKALAVFIIIFQKAIPPIKTYDYAKILPYVNKALDRIKK